MIAWDEPKRQENPRKHGIDLAALECVFDFPMATDEDDRVACGEQRLVGLGFYGGLVARRSLSPKYLLRSVLMPTC